MFYYALKVVVSAQLIVTNTEISERSTGFAAIIAALAPHTQRLSALQPL